MGELLRCTLADSPASLPPAGCLCHHVTPPSATAGLNLSQQKLLADPQLLKAILQYHVVPQRSLTTAQLSNRDMLPTLASGQLLEVCVPGPAGCLLTILSNWVGRRRLEPTPPPPPLSLALHSRLKLRT